MDDEGEILPEREAQEFSKVDSEAVEPVTLARRIQSLLSHMPIPTSNQSEPQGDTNSSAPPTLVSDPKLVTMLSSPSVMNGMLSKTHESVWSALDKLRAQLPGQRPTPSAPPAQAGEEEEILDDESGVMIYGPLFPNADTEIELAKSETVPTHETERPEETSPKPTPGGTWKDKLEGVWPFKGQDKGKQPEHNSPTRVKLPRSKRVWIPSPDKISVEVMWWGYRMYVHLFVDRLIVLSGTQIPASPGA